MQKEWTKLSFMDYLHRKAEDSAHNTILAYLAVILGAVFLVGGLLETIIVSESPSWFLLLPYQQPSNLLSFLGLVLTTLGFVLISTGFVLVVHYDRRRSWYQNQIEQSSMLEKEKEELRRKSHKQILVEINKRYPKD